MNKYLIAISSLIVIIIGYYYNHSEGLIISIANGEKIYSNSLMSSGGNGGFLISIGLMSFSFTFVASLLSFLKVVSPRMLGWVYSINLLFLAFVAFLVNLDVSIYDSIKFGDFLLLSGLIVSIIPLILLIKNAIQHRFAQER